MDLLVKDTLAILTTHCLLSRGDRVVIAVSGGPDSVALLYVLHALAGALDLGLVVAHLDHALREEESLRDALLVQEHARLLHCPVMVETADVRGHARAKGLSLEHAARELRYAFLARVAKTHNAGAIAVAHTADDQAEEILLRLIRGTARKGLSGMALIRDGIVIRPFLGIPKARLLAYLHARQIAYALDSSNLEPVCLRNRIRLDLLPRLEERYNANVRETLRQTADVLSDEEDLLAQMTDQAAAEVFVTPPAPAAAAGVSLELALPALRAQPRALQRRLLERALWKMGCRPGYRQIEELMFLAAATGTGKRVHLADGLRVKKTEERLVFFYPQGRKAGRGDLWTEPETDFAIEIQGPGRILVPALGKEFVFEQSPAPDFLEFEPGMNYLDLDLLVFPLLLRSPRPGDRFHPLGAPGRRKVSDFLVDLKISREIRRQVPVLVSGTTIVALLGLRVDHRFRLTPETRQLLSVRSVPPD